MHLVGNFILIIKCAGPAFTTRVDLLLELFPNSKFIYIEHKYDHVKSIEKSIKSFNKEFGFIPFPLSTISSLPKAALSPK